MAHRKGTRIDPLRDGSKMFGEMLTIRWNALTGNTTLAKIIAMSVFVSDSFQTGRVN